MKNIIQESTELSSGMRDHSSGWCFIVNFALESFALEKYDTVVHEEFQRKISDSENKKGSPEGLPFFGLIVGCDQKATENSVRIPEKLGSSWMSGTRLYPAGNPEYV